MSRRKLRVTLPDALETEIVEAVASGEFASETDAICSAMAEWRARRHAESFDAEELRRLCQAGLDRGHGASMSIEEIKAEARRRRQATVGVVPC